MKNLVLIEYYNCHSTLNKINNESSQDVNIKPSVKVVYPQNKNGMLLSIEMLKHPLSYTYLKILTEKVWHKFSYAYAF